jgi:predicted MFS family arabinose efflux permease
VNADSYCCGTESSKCSSQNWFEIDSANAASHFFSDLDISPSVGALMLSVPLTTAFLSRGIWGAISDRIGGLARVLKRSAWQVASMVYFLLTRNELGLFTVAAAFGLGFSGIIPVHVPAVRELFSPCEASSWRIPTLLLFTRFGMAAGGWLAGLLYDHFSYYAPAFAAGMAPILLLIGCAGSAAAHRAAYEQLDGSAF